MILTARLALTRNPTAIVCMSQFLGTSLWFSANGTGPSLVREWGATASDIGLLTSAVQVGFIAGSLILSLTGIADRFRAARLFVVASVAGALFNACFAWFATGTLDAILYRFLVGIALAGIYPIGMKLLVTWVREQPGWALSLLAGMLTLGTALPHAFQWVGSGLDWRIVAGTSSVLSLAGATLIHFLGDGPYGKPTRGTNRTSSGGFSHILAAFRTPAYRSAALGYFGHMWELYAFWTILPLVLRGTLAAGDAQETSVSGWAFLIMAAGTAGCVLGGLLSKRVGSSRVAAFALALSGLSGVLFLLFWRTLPPALLLTVLVVWGASVVADSPQFSALSAKACAPQSVGTALTIQNCIGFAVTIVSISAVTVLTEKVGIDGAWLLVLGPVLGLLGFRPWSKPSRHLVTATSRGNRG